MTDESVAKMRELVEAELSRFHDPAASSRLRELLVSPYPVERAWDYGAVDERYVCWTVAEHRPSDTAIVYCDRGFGPENPWGLVAFAGPGMNIGMDSGWFPRLEVALKDSMAWDDAAGSA
jgi:hypothetical protein